MKYNYIGLLWLTLLYYTAYGQVNERKLFGEYQICKTSGKVHLVDTTWTDTIPSIRISVVDLPRFLHSQNLILKRGGRFKIIDHSNIPTIGFNLDNPTIYGKYKRVRDTLILTYKKSIQHFSTSGPGPKKVKKKLNGSFKFKIADSGQLKISSKYSWIKAIKANVLLTEPIQMSN